jgi:hypothetical protein
LQQHRFRLIIPMLGQKNGISRTHQGFDSLVTSGSGSFLRALPRAPCRINCQNRERDPQQIASLLAMRTPGIGFMMQAMMDMDRPD